MSLSIHPSRSHTVPYTSVNTLNSKNTENNGSKVGQFITGCIGGSMCVGGGDQSNWPPLCVHELGGQHIITTRVIDRKRRRASGQGHLESWWHDSIWMGPALRCHSFSDHYYYTDNDYSSVQCVGINVEGCCVGGGLHIIDRKCFSLSSLLVVRLLMIIVERIHIQHHPI